MMKKFVTFKVGNDEYKLKYGIKELVELEEKLGVSLTQLGEKALSIKNIKDMMIVGLQNNQLSEDEAMDIIDEVGLKKMAELVNQAINLSLGTDTKKNN